MNQSIRVIPAILTDDPAALGKMLQQSETFTDYVQIDVMDNEFVPSKSISWEQIAAIKTNIKWEAHLMVEHPEKEMKNFRKAGAAKVIFHYEATSDPQGVIASARRLGLLVGIAVNPETPVTKIMPFTRMVDSVLFLSVHPGFYGAKFIPEVLDKIVDLRRAQPDLNIGIDGGIKENNIVLIAKSGVNEICVGSAIFMQPQPGDSYRKLQAMVTKLT